MLNHTQWCEIHEDDRSFSHQSTDRGEVVNVYVDKWTPSCESIVGTGKFLVDGHKPIA